MESKNQELRVWDRVQGKACVFRDTASIAAWYMEEKAWAERLAKLSGSTGERMLMSLSGRAKERAACLRGIYILLTGYTPGEPAREEYQTPMLALLRRAYVEGLGRKRQYERYCGDEEYGPVFSALSRDMEEWGMEMMKAVGRIARP